VDREGAVKFGNEHGVKFGEIRVEPDEWNCIASGGEGEE